MFQVHMMLTEEPRRTPCLTLAYHLSLERGIIFSTLLQANAGELKVLKLQKGQQLQVKVKNISGVGDVCACFWIMPSKCFGRVQRLLLWGVSMLLPRNSHPQIYLLLL
ncbi:unnamed protein product [Sphagnum tenellum]